MALFIGMAWVGYMVWHFGDDYWEGFHLHSLPFYAKRRVSEYSTAEMIRERQSAGPGLLLVKEPLAAEFGPGKVLWRGHLYGGSESRTLEFLLDCMAFEAGRTGRFIPFVLLYQSE